jgi:hypothetical protein
VAEDWFPFVAADRFTLRQFATQPRRWFAFTKVGTSKYRTPRHRYAFVTLFS